MEHKVASRTADKSAASSSSSSSRVLPIIARLRQYQRLASEQGIPFAIAEHAATAMMRRPCELCGVPSPAEGHGLTRLRIWPEGVARPPRGGFMGPFHPDNLAPACGMQARAGGHRQLRCKALSYCTLSNSGLLSRPRTQPPVGIGVHLRAG